MFCLKTTTGINRAENINKGFYEVLSIALIFALAFKIVFISFLLAFLKTSFIEKLFIFD